MWPLLFIFVPVMLVGCPPGELLKAGDKAPDFRADDLVGRTHYLNAELKRPVVLTFFATWCAPCKLEMPLLIDLQRQLNGRAQVLCVVIDPENRDRVQTFAAGLSIPFPLLLDQGQKIKQAYGVTELPVTFLIGTDGIIRSRYGPLGPAEIDDLRKQVTRLEQG